MPMSRWELRLAPEGGMFAISARDGHDLTTTVMNNDLVAADRPHDPFIAVKTTHSWRTVTVTGAWHGSAPAPDPNAEGWVELSLACPAGLLVGDLDGGRSRVLTRHSGEVRVRISVRDRKAAVALDDETPQRQGSPETFHIDAWPGSVAEPEVHLPPAPERPVPAPDAWRSARLPGDLLWNDDLRRAGYAGGERIGHRLRDPVTNQSGRVELAVRIPWPQRKTCNRLGLLGTWIGGGWPGELEVGMVTEHYFRQPDRFRGPYHEAPIAEAGYIELTYLEVARFRRVKIALNWRLADEPGVVATIGSGTPVLPEPSLVELTFADDTTDDEAGPWTRLTFTHTGIPSDWTTDLRAFWTWQMARLPEVAATHRWG